VAESNHSHYTLINSENLADNSNQNKVIQNMKLLTIKPLEKRNSICNIVYMYITPNMILQI